MIRPVDFKFSDLPIERVGLERGSLAEVYRLTGDLNANILLSFSSHSLQRKSKVTLENGEIKSDAWIRSI